MSCPSRRELRICTLEWLMDITGTTPRPRQLPKTSQRLQTLSFKSVALILAVIILAFHCSLLSWLLIPSAPFRSKRISTWSSVIVSELYVSLHSLVVWRFCGPSPLSSGNLSEHTREHFGLISILSCKRLHLFAGLKTGGLLGISNR